MMNMLDTDCKSGYIEHQNGYSKSEKIVVIYNLGGKSFKYKWFKIDHNKHWTLI